MSTLDPHIIEQAYAFFHQKEHDGFGKQLRDALAKMERMLSREPFDLQ